MSERDSIFTQPLMRKNETWNRNKVSVCGV